METEINCKTSVSSPNDSGKRVMFDNDKVFSKEDSTDADVVKLISDNTRRTSVYILNQFTDIKHTGLGIGEKCFYWFYKKVKFLRRKWFTHCFLIIVIFVYTVGGALIFLTVEGQNEIKLIKWDIRLEVQDLLNDLRSKSLRVPMIYTGGEWKGEAARKIAKCEEKVCKAYDKHPLVVSNTNGKVWTIWNSIVYCSTLYTTIGYGHLYPTTFTGRVLTIAYSTIGIPLFLIALADFGKLFTKCIKFFWSYIRRLYYTGSCRTVRRTSHVQELMKGAQSLYEYATFRKFSTNLTDAAECGDVLPKTNIEPQTPALSNFEIDDEFNLPISLALFILIAYMLLGTAFFMVLEDWKFFPSFYFVFISMSTVGFGDVVPQQPVHMILSIIYLCFGLALMSMCINVVQDKLSDTFSRASAKLGSTIETTPNEGMEDVVS